MSCGCGCSGNNSDFGSGFFDFDNDGDVDFKDLKTQKGMFWISVAGLAISVIVALKNWG